MTAPDAPAMPVALTTEIPAELPTDLPSPARVPGPAIGLAAAKARAARKLRAAAKLRVSAILPGLAVGMGAAPTTVTTPATPAAATKTQPTTKAAAKAPPAARVPAARPVPGMKTEPVTTGTPVAQAPDETRGLPAASLAPTSAVEMILRHVQDAVFATDLENRVTYWADSAERLFGYSPADAVGQAFGELMSFEIAGGDGETGLLETIEAGRTWRGEGTVRRRDGTELWLESTVSPIDLNGKVVGSVSVSRDVTAAMATRRSLAAEQRFVDAVLDAAGSPVIVLDATGSIVRFNRACELLSGYASAEVAGRPYWDALVPGEEAEAVRDAFLALRDGAAPHVVENHWSARSGARPLIAWANATLKDLDGRVTHVIGTGTDITEQRGAEEALRGIDTVGEQLAKLGSERLWPALIEAVGAVVAADVIGVTVLEQATGRYILRAVRGMEEAAIGTEIRPGEGTSGQAIATRAIVILDDVERREHDSAVRSHGYDVSRSTLAVPLIREDVVLGAITVGRAGPGAAFSRLEAEVMTLLGAQAALALANARLLDEVSELAVRDGLTGLFNRRHFDASLELVVARWRREVADARPLSAVLFDLDHFGRFNKEHGHQAGDAVLREFAGILRARFRASDLVGRYGGEEFVVIMENATREQALVAADEVREELESRTILGPNGQPLRAHVSAGCAAFDQTDPSPEAFLRTADVALAMAKRAGRNQVVAA